MTVFYHLCRHFQRFQPDCIMVLSSSTNGFDRKIWDGLTWTAESNITNEVFIKSNGGKFNSTRNAIRFIKKIDKKAIIIMCG